MNAYVATGIAVVGLAALAVCVAKQSKPKHTQNANQPTTGSLMARIEKDKKGCGCGKP
jgi:hypothetical protein